MSIRYVTAMPRPSRESLSGKVLEEIRREFGSEAEPFTLHRSLPEVLAGAWMACRETLLAGNGRREARETVAATVSALNCCPYCVDAHSLMLRAATGRAKQIGDTHLRDIAAWAAATRTPQSALLRDPPFSPDEAPAFRGTAVFFHYINRMVTILLGSSPLPLKTGICKEVSMRLAAWYFTPAIRKRKIPGRSLWLLPEAPLPPDLSWAEPSPAIAGAFARFAHTVEIAGTAACPDPVRALTDDAIRRWDGSDAGMTTQWCEAAVARLNEIDRPSGRLALLTALSPYRVTPELVRDFSERMPGDRALIGMLSWCSLKAARKIGSWI